MAPIVSRITALARKTVQKAKVTIVHVLTASRKHQELIEAVQRDGASSPAVVTKITVLKTLKRMRPRPQYVFLAAEEILKIQEKRWHDDYEAFRELERRRTAALAEGLDVMPVKRPAGSPGLVRSKKCLNLAEMDREAQAGRVF